MPPGPRIDIYNTSEGYVSPSPNCETYAASAADSMIERAIADAAQRERFAPGVYIAKWETEHGRSEYIFTVRIETHRTHHVEVEP